eukprot:CAMPEP_0175138412 /NCGR_PEP_ID=MMETSP0087-20121206/10338_1 /TAXON_ID=136419 /ORGANISM="Unknown Unknown, Strain D1" /LENGTH=658 /DNA_ID=CAMNT_0016421319 /DNA_START=32 /DNA_END=2004 /DNA_ORIENTATION=-
MAYQMPGVMQQQMMQQQMMMYQQQLWAQQQRAAATGPAARAAAGPAPSAATQAAAAQPAATVAARPAVVPQRPALPPGQPPPAPVPPGWASQWDANSKAYYYYEIATGKTQWEPVKMPVAPTAPIPPPQPKTYSAAPTASNGQASNGGAQVRPAINPQRVAMISGGDVPPGMGSAPGSSVAGMQSAIDAARARAAQLGLTPHTPAPGVMPSYPSMNPHANRMIKSATAPAKLSQAEKRAAKKAKNQWHGPDVGDNALDDDTSLTEEVKAWREENNITTSGGCPAPLFTFEQAGIPATIMAVINQMGFKAPSPIQAQAWPAVLTGRDVIGVAKTGSGKTLGFLYPVFKTILAGYQANLRNGPVGLVLCPTRELAIQIKEECVRFGSPCRISCCCVFGGMPKHQQRNEFRQGVHIIIATPGRLQDFLEERSINLSQVAYLTFDEADRMLDMGFEPQIRAILRYVPSQRQTMFFTATWPKSVRRLASEFLRSPIIVYIGDANDLQANPDIKQHVTVLQDMRQKDFQVQKAIGEVERGARVIIFCSTKRMCDQLARNLTRMIPCAAIHGDKDQHQRNMILANFKSGRCPVMVATDVAARGLDVDDVKLVINYDFPNNVEDYVHRIGRTARGGKKGVSHTFVTMNDARKMSELIVVMEKAGQT